MQATDTDRDTGKRIVYNRHDHDFGAYFDGQLIGFCKTYHDAETLLNEYTFDLFSRGLYIPDDTDPSDLSDVGPVEPRAVNWNS